jgi:hypothetical protein
MPQSLSRAAAGATGLPSAERLSDRRKTTLGVMQQSRQHVQPRLAVSFEPSCPLRRFRSRNQWLPPVPVHSGHFPACMEAHHNCKKRWFR